MNPIISYITIDLSANNNFDYIRAVQGDSNTRYVHITLLDKQNPYVLTNIEPVLRGTKPDGTTIFNKCCVSGNDEIIVELTSQMLAVAGVGKYEIALYSSGQNDEVVASFPFNVYISPACFDPSVVISSNEFTELTEVISNIGEIKESVEQAQEASNSASQSATNAKNYADQALDSANDSNNFANKSEASALQSKGYAESSEQYSVEVSENATNAQNSANESKTYAESAQTYSDESNNYALLSESYAHGNTGVREGEDTDNSKYYAEQAKNSSTTAATYLTQVEQAGDDAVNKINSAISFNNPVFYFDNTTGHLSYEGGRFNWALDENGHLLWEVSA